MPFFQNICGLLSSYHHIITIIVEKPVTATSYLIHYSVEGSILSKDEIFRLLSIKHVPRMSLSRGAGRRLACRHGLHQG